MTRALLAWVALNVGFLAGTFWKSGVWAASSLGSDTPDSQPIAGARGGHPSAPLRRAEAELIHLDAAALDHLVARCMDHLTALQDLDVRMKVEAVIAASAPTHATDSLQDSRD